MEPIDRRRRRPARVSRWVASGLTAAVAVGSVSAMAEAAEDETEEFTGAALGATSAWRAEVVAAELMAAAAAEAAQDAEEAAAAATSPPPPRIGRAGAS